MRSLAALSLFLSAALRRQGPRLLLPLLALALPPLRAATFGDFEYTDTGTTITIDRYTGAGGAVTIPTEIDRKPVAAIGIYAFYLCPGLTSVTIPDSVTSIGAFAFFYCAGLTSVTIPDSATSIGDFAFIGCSGLTSIDVSTANSAFASADGVLFTKTLATLIQYPASKPQTSYTIPDSVTSIGAYAFHYSSGLSSVTIPDSVTSIGDLAFYGCIGLASINVATANSAYTSVDGVLFNKTLTTLSQYPAAKLQTSYSVPTSVTSIEACAFFYNSGLTSVTIPDSVTAIEGRAFRNCSGLTSVAIPAGLTSIGDSVFDGCNRLASAIFLGNAPQSFGLDVFKNSSPAFTIYYPGTSTGFTTPLWKGYPSQMGFPTYAQWIAGFGLGANDQAPESSPAGDGLPNLVKYALWLDPTLPATSGCPVLVSEDGKLVYRVPLSLLTTGITSAIQTSDDLVNWDDALTTIESSTATTVTASVSLPTGTPRRFARLAVTQP